MAESPERVELLHSCAFCGAPAAMLPDSGFQLSVIDQRRRVIGWAVHRQCLAQALSPLPRAAFDQTYPSQ